jgi:hypothetical protein
VSLWPNCNGRTRGSRSALPEQTRQMIRRRRITACADPDYTHAKFLGRGRAWFRCLSSRSPCRLGRLLLLIETEFCLTRLPAGLIRSPQQLFRLSLGRPSGIGVISGLKPSRLSLPRFFAGYNQL